MPKARPAPKARTLARASAPPRPRPRGSVLREARASRAAPAGQTLDILDKTYPDADCALKWRNPYELLPATILSAQCTDDRVNHVTPAILARHPAPPDAARSPAADG